jgi:hypothetical protein
MKKWGDLNIALQLNIWIAMTICISFTTHCNFAYYYGHECHSTNCTSYNRCNSPYMKPYTYAIHTTHLQLCRNNYFVTLIQLICKYHGNVRLASFFICPSKFDTWYFEDFWVIFFENIDFHHHYDCSFIMVLDFDTCHNKSCHMEN